MKAGASKRRPGSAKPNGNAQGAQGPALRLRIVQSSVQPGMLSLRVDGLRGLDALDLRRAIMAAGFKVGDVAELRRVPQ